METSDIFNLLQLRLTPIAKYGAPYLSTTPCLPTIYDDTMLPAFLLKNRADPTIYPDILILNRIGSVFDELVPGTPLIIPQTINTFSQNPYA